ncbi:MULTISPECIES: alpha-E domain-containing protein [Corallincola]|uniref:Alpha-E domain-containing protein n=2 Tax=Corallincola TaxID=1775176 RepID=A0A368N492_9GAMM|nr:MULTISPECIES: alpha-E domain-containing protein [Corallincola]RCU45318.1 alpha-E domain-containing protein [Corallincola holothuriorum]TAA42594.1 alpha-E domain-containing protein [Corallincola spongiicola]
MLSRVAENIYWMGRYAERADNTARLVKSTYEMMLDLPRTVPVSWSGLLDVLGCWPEKMNHEQVDEAMVMASIIGDKENSCSVISAVGAARQNARNTREMLPQSSWEVLNSCFLYTRANQGMLSNRQGRIRYCQQVQKQSEQFVGIMMNSMDRDLGFSFFRIGQLLERADMITRIIDAKATSLLQLEEDDSFSLDKYRTFFWLNALDSLEATQSFRKLIKRGVRRETVMAFLLEDPRQPRAVMYCLSKVQALLTELPKNADLIESVSSIQSAAVDCSVCELEEVTEKMDVLQRQLANLHDSIGMNYFAFRNN